MSYQTTPAPSGMAGNGGLLRWDGTSANLTALPVTAGSPNTVTADWDAFREWYPGIKQGRLQVTNTSGEPITVTLQAASDSASGCWYAPSWADAPAFPTAGVTVPARQTSAIYTMGAYTAGTDGSCAATNNTDIWRGYLVVTPVNHPADARLVRLRLNPNMTVDVTNQAGGATTVSIQNAQQQLAAFGLWTVVVDTPAAPTPLSPPTVTGARVTPAETPGPAVYRFDVTGATFQLGTRMPNQIVIPPLTVQGSSTARPGPISAPWCRRRRRRSCRRGPVRAAGRPGDVLVGEPDRPARLPAHPGRDRIGGPSVGGGDVGGPAGPGRPDQRQRPPDRRHAARGVAAPVDSGIDQAPLSVQVLDNNSEPLPPTDPSYQRIYYRARHTTR